MEAPVLSKNQMKKALKKKVVKKSIRSALSKPKTLTWPEISPEDSSKLRKALVNILFFKNNTKVNWKDLRNVSRDQRKEERQKILARNGKTERPDAMKNIIFGLNSVSKALENKILTSVLVSSDSNNTDMFRHLWYGCDVAHIPLVAMPKLREIMKEIVGFPVLAMGLKKCNPQNPLDTVYEMVCELDSKFTGRTYPYTETVNLDDTILEEEEEIPEKIEEKKPVYEFYLYRNSSKRVFIPPNSKGNTDTPYIADLDSDFISFGGETETVKKNLPPQNKKSKSLAVNSHKLPVNNSLASQYDPVTNLPTVNPNIQVIQHLPFGQNYLANPIAIQSSPVTNLPEVNQNLAGNNLPVNPNLPFRQNLPLGQNLTLGQSLLRSQQLAVNQNLPLNQILPFGQNLPLNQNLPQNFIPLNSANQRNIDAVQNRPVVYPNLPHSQNFLPINSQMLPNQGVQNQTVNQNLPVVYPHLQNLPQTQLGLSISSSVNPNRQSVNPMDDSVIFVSEGNIDTSKMDVDSENSNSTDTNSLLNCLESEIVIRENDKGKGNTSSDKLKKPRRRRKNHSRKSGSVFLRLQVKRLQGNPNRKGKKKNN